MKIFLLSGRLDGQFGIPSIKFLTDYWYKTLDQTTRIAEKIQSQSINNNSWLGFYFWHDWPAIWQILLTRKLGSQKRFRVSLSPPANSDSIFDLRILYCTSVYLFTWIKIYYCYKLFHATRAIIRQLTRLIFFLFSYTNSLCKKTKQTKGDGGWFG